MSVLPVAAMVTSCVAMDANVLFISVAWIHHGAKAIPSSRSLGIAPDARECATRLRGRSVDSLKA